MLTCLSKKWVAKPSTTVSMACNRRDERRYASVINGTGVLYQTLSVKTTTGASYTLRGLIWSDETTNMATLFICEKSYSAQYLTSSLCVSKSSTAIRRWEEIAITITPTISQKLTVYMASKGASQIAFHELQFIDMSCSSLAWDAQYSIITCSPLGGLSGAMKLEAATSDPGAFASITLTVTANTTYTLAGGTQVGARDCDATITRLSFCSGAVAVCVGPRNENFFNDLDSGGSSCFPVFVPSVFGTLTNFSIPFNVTNTTVTVYVMRGPTPSSNVTNGAAYFYGLRLEVSTPPALLHQNLLQLSAEPAVDGRLRFRESLEPDTFNELVSLEQTATTGSTTPTPTPTPTTTAVAPTIDTAALLKQATDAGKFVQ
jgi:hypothetical protein